MPQKCLIISIHFPKSVRYLVMSRDQNTGRSHSINIDNSSLETVEDFKYFGTTLTNQNCIQEEIKSRLKSGNACYHSVQNLLSASLLSKNLKNYNLPVFVYGCETWSLTLREDGRPRAFENRVLRIIFGSKRDEVIMEWRKLLSEELNYLYSSLNIIILIKSRMRWAGHVALMGERGAYKWFWWGNLRRENHLEDQGVDGRTILRWIFRKWNVGVWTG